MYHHSRTLDSVVFGEVKASHKYTNKYDKAAYSWLADNVGFYPLFLAVGQREDDLWRTEYDRQFKRYEKGKYPNEVLFSFRHVQGVFMDAEYWNIQLMTNFAEESPTQRDYRWTLKPQWHNDPDKWLRLANRSDSRGVDLVVPSLYLPDALRVWVRNKPTKTLLEELGFTNVEVRRIKVFN